MKIDANNKNNKEKLTNNIWNNNNKNNEQQQQLLISNNNFEDGKNENNFNHSSCPSSNSANGQDNLLNIGNLQKPDLEYLGQLLKDKKQLSAFPNVFSHIERLVDEEINRVRIAIFQCEFNNEPLQLPEPIGDISIHQEKLFVPIKQYPDYNFVGRILGPRGMTAKQLETETGCKIMVRGKGSMRDKKKEELNKGKPNWEHLDEDLHVIIQCEDTKNRSLIKMNRAIDEVNKLLIPQPEGEDELKRKQLMELAIINGTFRNGIQQQINSTNKNNNSLIQLDQQQQRLLLNSLGCSNTSTLGGLAGVPLMIAPPSSSTIIKGISNNNNILQQLNNNSTITQTLLQLSGISNNILNTPGPYGLPLPQQNINGNNSLDLINFGGANQFSQQDQQLSLLIQQQQQQMALLQQQQNNGISLGEYNNNNNTNNFGGGTETAAGAILSGQRRFIGHSRDVAFPYGK